MNIFMEEQSPLFQFTCQVHTSAQDQSLLQHLHKNMYFHAVKSTAHPPFIGALGHSTDCIVKQSYTFAFVQACCVLLEEKLHLQTIKHTDIKKFNVRLACCLLLLLSVSVCADCG